MCLKKQVMSFLVISLVFSMANNDFWQCTLHVDSPRSLKCWLLPEGTIRKPMDHWSVPVWQLSFVAMQDNQLLSYLCMRVPGSIYFAFVYIWFNQQ